MKSLLTTKVSTTEESREGVVVQGSTGNGSKDEKLHAGICAGGAVKSAFIPRLCLRSIE